MLHEQRRCREEQPARFGATWENRHEVKESRAPEHPATNNCGLQAGRYPEGTTWDEQENTYIGILDIRIPLEKKPVERLRQREETEQEDAEAGKRRSERTHEEQRRPEQRTHEGKLNGGQESPECGDSATSLEGRGSSRSVLLTKQRKYRVLSQERMLALDILCLGVHLDNPTLKLQYGITWLLLLTPKMK
ncbi:hypothetical protein NDU88_005483 [Pleurodeles waltl]|uniref:Uncharacterized protein n=1 Tax=Pleurodeles waltl TaxID=8319 RepID=A0AAV7MD21_PLEWA|nr:hypothetical protein NDU88_005483 [Pleurodeles waltl]